MYDDKDSDIAKERGAKIVDQPPKSKVMTTAAGCPLANNSHSLTAGEKGPLLMQDYQLIEKLAHQNRERIPERVVHAKGWGAYGSLIVSNPEVYMKYSRAAVFKPGAETHLLARFSTVSGELGAADNERDVRGFALKFYTEEGNWDMVGNNTPVFFIRDPYKFPDFVHTQKRHPRTNLRSATAMWDFWSQTPESLHQITILFSERGCPQTPMHMNGYGSHTYSLINHDNERFWVKFHFKTQQGHEHYSDEEAKAVIGESREGYQEALFASIEEGHYPKWTMMIQVMPEEDAEKTPYDPFDLTKVWPHKDYPLIEVGEIELTRNPNNYFSEIEQVAMSPSNIVPGIGFSPDRVLQARIFSYPDAQRYRLGGNYQTLPVNQPMCPVHHHHKGGVMNSSIHNPDDADLFYFPNSTGGPEPKGDHREPPLKISGDAARYKQNKGNDDYTQAGDLFRMFDVRQKNELCGNIANAMQGVSKDIIDKQLKLFDKVDQQYGDGVRTALDEMNSRKA